ncbi:hypothetical protein [Nonomuraea sp. NPDC050310]|uniref:hypothetical protein n=1 Tax=unclassified Nonomuraea TaxID=2593643 RepID=UPI0033C3C506
MASQGWRGRALGVAAVLAVLALAAFAVLQWTGASNAEQARGRLAAERDLRAQVSVAAREFARALLSYDYQDLPAARATLARLSTGDFMALYDREFGAATRRSILAHKAVSQATVREVYLGEVGEATARAVVVVDSRVESGQPVREVHGSHLKLLLVREGAAWKAQEVTILSTPTPQPR